MNPAKRLVAFGCGCGKTRATLTLSRKRAPNISDILVVAPKTQVQDRTWEREAAKLGWEEAPVVISKEKFRKDWRLHPGKVLVLDESHMFTGVTSQTRQRNKVEIPKASQLFEAVEQWVAMYKPNGLYLCSATPFPQPMALYAVFRLFGHEVDYHSFRRKFYSYVPTIGRGVWIPKKDKETEQLLSIAALKVGSFGRLSDFADVPDQVEKDVEVGTTPQQRRMAKEVPLMYPEPVVRIGKLHQLEQGVLDGLPVEENKLSEIEELAREFDKLLVFAKYTAQVDAIAAHLRGKFKGRDVLILDGRTKDRRSLMVQAEDKDRKTIVVAQSQVSTGYELPSFRCTAFASLSYSFVDYEQARGRTLRMNAIAKNVYVHLVAGDVDRAVLECVRHKRDFNEALFTAGKTTT